MDIFLKLFAPPAANLIDGKTWAEMTLVERLTSYDWTKELCIVGLLLAYIALHFYGVSTNKKKVDQWVSKHKPLLDEEFAQVGVQMGPGKELVVSDSPTIFTTYASGRLNIAHLMGRFKLMGRQNFVTLTMDYVFALMSASYQVKDSIDLVLTPSADAKIEPFIFAIVNKGDMKVLREDNYYLSLTRTVDSEKLPDYMAFMTENAEVTDTLFTTELCEAIQDSQNVLEYLAITDQEINQPKTLEEAEPRPVVRLGLKFPSNEQEWATSRKIVAAACQTIDMVASKKKWRPEVVKKIKATRDTEVKKVQKQLDDKRAEERALAKAEAERERRKELSKLSNAELRKIEQKERDKDQKRKINKSMKKSR